MLLCTLTALGADASLPAPKSAPAADTVSVKLVTFYPGNEPFEVFGHSEIRVTQGTADYYFNYGVFDFNSPNFIFRFVLGECDYLCVAYPRQVELAGHAGRRMEEQSLNLTQQQACAVRDFLLNNVRPENSEYRYKFLTDNCSTRPRDIVEMAAGPGLDYGTLSGGMTYRDILADCCRHYSWEKFGIDLVLGSAVDTVLSVRAQMFVPMLLHDAVAQATVLRDGRRVPLVSDTQVVIDGSVRGQELPPTPWWCHPLTVALVVLALTIWVTVADVRRRRVTRWYDSTLFGIYGLAGCVIAFLLLFSTHEAVSPNWNIVWLHPLLLLLAVLPWRKASRRLARWLHVANAVLVALLLLAMPWVPQVMNAAFYPLMCASVARSVANAVLLARPIRAPAPKG